MTIKKPVDSDAADFNRLKSDGFEFIDPQDEFSYQPDSSGLNGGAIGREENGIDSEILEDDEISVEDDPEVQVPGESQWSQDHRLPFENQIDEQKEYPLTDSMLLTLAHKRLSEHPRLANVKIEIHVKNTEITLTGEVPSISLKMLAQEIVSSLSGVRSVQDEIVVSSIR